jgi:hypothetical protein
VKSDLRRYVEQAIAELAGIPTSADACCGIDRTARSDLERGFSDRLAEQRA